MIKKKCPFMCLRGNIVHFHVFVPLFASFYPAF